MVDGWGARVAQVDGTGKPLSDQLEPVKAALKEVRARLPRLRGPSEGLRLLRRNRLEKMLPKCKSLREVPQ